MRIAIMQPYFLPYMGYWQLLASVDKFVILDDVNFINRGWINRNRIWLGGQPAWLTIPLSGASQNKMIRQIDILSDDGWHARMEKSVFHAYASAPRFAEIYELFKEMLGVAEGNLSGFLHRTIVDVCGILGIKTEIISSSSIFPKGELKGQDRILDICKRIGATAYVNPPGGRELYEQARFEAEGISLYFLQPGPTGDMLQNSSPQGDILSILDTLMQNDQPSVSKATGQFSLLKS